ncbi:unnamed protein product [Oppiella nova]|uniref:Vacuolar protein sorting-associated protein 52 homolog n=1 Tax=Oppiella nova TaxID=334625 RepID=A0A7R9LRE3_9ACAR|nr:unnamed protein product [Oppiella nova]CAG2165868.1 unnamed protein product [Oppiella nova]
MNDSKLETEMSEVDNTLGEDLVKEVLQSGVDLRSYSKEVEKSLTDIENASVNDYILQSEAIASLHSEITSSDQILERLEGMLCSFQADLGNICQEILSLQELSVSLNQRLKNKQTIRSNLSQFVDDMIVSEASGVDLRSYSKEVEKSLTDIENASVNDYILQSEAIASLHSEITSSDQILERLEGMLCSFQADLGNICQEILSLQELSVSLNQRLKNKQTIRSNLSQFVDDMIVSEAVIAHIVDTPVSEKEFLEQLYVLDHKITFVKEQSFREAKSCSDVLQILNNLKIKAITKIREYCLKKIHSCRKAMTNYQIPQNALLKNKFFYQFLMTHDREVAREGIDILEGKDIKMCTVLHQCDDESGCCDVGTERCVAQTSQTVDLYFYVIHADLKDNNTGGNGGRTEVLRFVNHTKCHCQEINYMPRTKPMPEHWQSGPTHHYKPAYSMEATTTPEPTITTTIRADVDSDNFALRCRCPHPFIARINPSDERCICDCLERDHHCIRIKRGRHKLSPLEARCVRAGDCSEPMCDFGGTYSKVESSCIASKHSQRTRIHGRHHHQRHQKQAHWLHERD